MAHSFLFRGADSRLWLGLVGSWAGWKGLEASPAPRSRSASPVGNPASLQREEPRVARARLALAEAVLADIPLAHGSHMTMPSVHTGGGEGQ